LSKTAERARGLQNITKPRRTPEKSRLRRHRPSLSHPLEILFLILVGFRHIPHRLSSCESLPALPITLKTQQTSPFRADLKSAEATARALPCHQAEISPGQRRSSRRARFNS
jgi:hypothetical protein